MLLAIWFLAGPPCPEGQVEVDGACVTPTLQAPDASPAEPLDATSLIRLANGPVRAKPGSAYGQQPHAEGEEHLAIGRGPIVVGDLDRDAAIAIIEAARPRVDACYAEARAAQPELAGKLRVKLTIDMEGAVAERELRNSTLAHPGLEACVLEVYGALRFPEPKGRGVALVDHTLEFRPE